MSNHTGFICPEALLQATRYIKSLINSNIIHSNIYIIIGQSTGDIFATVSYGEVSPIELRSIAIENFILSARSKQDVFGLPKSTQSDFSHCHGGAANIDSDIIVSCSGPENIWSKEINKAMLYCIRTIEAK